MSPTRRSRRLLHVLMPALGDCADPDRAVANLGRWGDAVTSRVSAYGLLAAHPVAARMLVTVFAASQFFADLLIQTPEYLEVLLNPAIRDRGRDLAAFQSDLSGASPSPPRPTPSGTPCAGSSRRKSCGSGRATCWATRPCRRRPARSATSPRRAFRGAVQICVTERRAAGTAVRRHRHGQTGRAGTQLRLGH